MLYSRESVISGLAGEFLEPLVYDGGGGTMYNPKRQMLVLRLMQLCLITWDRGYCHYGKVVATGKRMVW